MALWDRLTWVFRLRGGLADRPEDAEVEVQRLRRPEPTPTTRVPKRPEPTPTTRARKAGGRTAGTPSYGAPKGTPSTQRIHNPTHFR